jgi:hypothetical protein
MYLAFNISSFSLFLGKGDLSSIRSKTPHRFLYNPLAGTLHLFTHHPPDLMHRIPDRLIALMADQPLHFKRQKGHHEVKVTTKIINYKN